MTLRFASSFLTRSFVEQLRSKPSRFCRLQEQLGLFARQLSRSSVHDRKRKQGLENESNISDDINPNLKKAARSVAESLPGDAKNIESDLLKQLRLHSSSVKTPRQDVMEDGKIPETQTDQRDRLKSILAGMKVEADKRVEKPSEHAQPSRDYEPRVQTSFRKNRMEIDQRRQELSDSIKLFQGPGLGIFTSKQKTEPVTKDGRTKNESLWDRVEAEALDRLALYPPQNAFEELIQMTKEGKLWTFPINNEAGMTQESQVGFHEHVFLDRLLEEFPQRGPVRHFMELVTTGLSQNPYLTVQQKEDHINWFRHYFKEKQAILEESLGPDGVMKTAVDSK